jgi:hypothetical protein
MPYIFHIHIYFIFFIGVKIGYFSFINQWFLHNSKLKTSASHICANQLGILLANLLACYYYKSINLLFS